MLGIFCYFNEFTEDYSGTKAISEFVNIKELIDNKNNLSAIRSIRKEKKEKELDTKGKRLLFMKF